MAAGAAANALAAITALVAAVAAVQLLLYMCEQYRRVSARPGQDLPGHGHLGNLHVSDHP